MSVLSKIKSALGIEEETWDEEAPPPVDYAPPPPAPEPEKEDLSLSGMVEKSQQEFKDHQYKDGPPVPSEEVMDKRHSDASYKGVMKNVVEAGRRSGIEDSKAVPEEEETAEVEKITEEVTSSAGMDDDYKDEVSPEEQASVLAGTKHPSTLLEGTNYRDVMLKLGEDLASEEERLKQELKSGRQEVRMTQLFKLAIQAAAQMYAANKGIKTALSKPLDTGERERLEALQEDINNDRGILRRRISASRSLVSDLYGKEKQKEAEELRERRRLEEDPQAMAKAQQKYDDRMRNETLNIRKQMVGKSLSDKAKLLSAYLKISVDEARHKLGERDWAFDKDLSYEDETAIMDTMAEHKLGPRPGGLSSPSDTASKPTEEPPKGMPHLEELSTALAGGEKGTKPPELEELKAILGVKSEEELLRIQGTTQSPILKEAVRIELSRRKN